MQLRLSPNQLSDLLSGRVVETTHHGPKGPARGGSYPILMQERTEVRAVVAMSKLRPRCKRIWVVNLVLDSADAPLLLNAESAGGVITPLSEDHSANEPLAHGYRSDSSNGILDAGEGIPHADVETFEESQVAARRFASERVDELAKRRARSLSNRVKNALMQARAHEPSNSEALVEGLECWLDEAEQAVREVAQ